MVIPLKEKVPMDYTRLYLFYGEGDFTSMILVNGTQEMLCGSRGTPTDQTVSDLMDWQAQVVSEIRAELELINLFPNL